MAKKKLYLTRLYDLAKGTHIYGLDAKVDGAKKHQPIIVEFDHVDGMYSFNYVLDLDGNKILTKDNSPAIVHIANTSILKKVGDHFEMATEEEAKDFKD